MCSQKRTSRLRLNKGGVLVNLQGTSSARFCGADKQSTLQTHLVSVRDGPDLHVEVELGAKDLPLIREHPEQASSDGAGADQSYANRLQDGPPWRNAFRETKVSQPRHTTSHTNALDTWRETFRRGYRRLKKGVAAGRGERPRVEGQQQDPPAV